VLSTSAYKLKLDEEKEKHARLAQQDGFGPACFPILLRLLKRTETLTPAREQCNNYDLIIAPCF